MKYPIKTYYSDHTITFPDPMDSDLGWVSGAHLGGGREDTLPVNRKKSSLNKQHAPKIPHKGLQ